MWHSCVQQHSTQGRSQCGLTPTRPHTSAQVERLEAQWPQSAAALLLALAADSPRYEAPLFETGLAECKFDEYPIDTWSRATLAVWALILGILGMAQGRGFRALEGSGRLQAQQGPHRHLEQGHPGGVGFMLG